MGDYESSFTEYMLHPPNTWSWNVCSWMWSFSRHYLIIKESLTRDGKIVTGHPPQAGLGPSVFIPPSKQCEEWCSLFLSLITVGAVFLHSCTLFGIPTPISNVPMLWYSLQQLYHTYGFYHTGRLYWFSTSSYSTHWHYHMVLSGKQLYRMWSKWVREYSQGCCLVNLQELRLNFRG